MMQHILLIISALLGALASADDHLGTFVNTDVFELEVAMDPQISPDGSKIAYVRAANDIMTDSTLNNIWLVSSDGADQRPLLSGTASYSNPRWSHDGNRLAYLSSAEGRGPQLYVRWMDTGQTALLSNLQNAPRGLSWSPDDSRIAFSALVATEQDQLATAPAMPEGADWAPGVKVISDLNYRTDGRGYLESGHSQIFLLPADGGTPRQITQGEFNHGGKLDWTPDGNGIIFSANRNEDWRERERNSDLWSVNYRTGEMRQLTDRNGPDYAPSLSPDGSRLAYLGYEDRLMGYHNSQVSILDLNNGKITQLTEGLDRSIDWVEWAGSSSQLLISFDDFGKRKLASVDMEGNLRPLVSDVGSAGISRPYTSGNFTVSDDGAYAYTAGGPDRPADVAVGHDDSAIRLTDLNADLLGHKTLGEVREISWRSSVDDHDIYGWLVTPPGFDEAQEYPLLLEIHGGPFTAYGPHFSTEVQLYAAAGYVVLYTNPRGSTSYGYEFANEIHHNYPSQDYDDLMSGVDAVIDMGFIDEEQLFVTGGSGGGVLTAWIVGNTDRFAAAAVAKPVINWISHALYSDIPEGVTRYWFEKLPWDDFDAYWARSPLSLVGNVTTPTLLLTGEADYRTPIAESEQYFQALKLRQVDTAMVRVPEASHGIASRPSHQIAKVDNILAWFARYRTADQE